MSSRVVLFAVPASSESNGRLPHKATGILSVGRARAFTKAWPQGKTFDNKTEDFTEEETLLGLGRSF